MSKKQKGGNKKGVNGGKEKKPTNMIQVIIFDDGSIELKGFPNHTWIAINIMTKALVRIFTHFYLLAVDGKAKADGTIEMPVIIPPPDKKIVTLQ